MPHQYIWPATCRKVDGNGTIKFYEDHMFQLNTNLKKKIKNFYILVDRKNYYYYFKYTSKNIFKMLFHKHLMFIFKIAHNFMTAIHVFFPPIYSCFHRSTLLRYKKCQWMLVFKKKTIQCCSDIFLYNIIHSFSKS